MNIVPTTYWEKILGDIARNFSSNQSTFAIFLSWEFYNQSFPSLLKIRSNIAALIMHSKISWPVELKFTGSLTWLLWGWTQNLLTTIIGDYEAHKVSKLKNDNTYTSYIKNIVSLDL